MLIIELKVIKNLGGFVVKILNRLLVLSILGVVLEIVFVLLICFIWWGLLSFVLWIIFVIIFNFWVICLINLVILLSFVIL